MTIECRSPDCSNLAVVKFCESHTALFAKIRDELDDGREERRRSGAIRRSRRRFPTCAMYECSDPAKPGSKFCLYHLRRRGV